MNVELISHTEDAVELLLYTKNTRLQGGKGIEEIFNWSDDKKLDELAYMKDTIKSSWEFIDYIFEITGVSRAFTHQLVRTRNASYAQQSMRAVDVRGNGWVSPSKDKYDSELLQSYYDMMGSATENYEDLIAEGMEVQDARGVIPTNIQTNIMMKVNLRELHDMAEVRLCTRTQGEYQEVFKLMKEKVVEVHPWADEWIQVFCANHGSCCFPRFTECPIQKYTYNADPLAHSQVKNEIRKQHASTTFAANPVVKDARTDGSE